MPQFVKEWMSHTVISIGPESSLQEAIVLLCRNNVQFLFITDSNTSRFVISSLQIRSYPTADKSLTRVSDLMIPLTTYADPNWPLEKALFEMQKQKTSFLPVQNKNNEIVGMLSIEAFYIAAQEIKWRIDSLPD